MIVYSKTTGASDSAIGKIETPIKMIIEHESDLISKKGGVCDWLFNVEKSNKFGETIIGQRDFDIFNATKEGEGATIDTVSDVYKKFIEHIQYTKEFVITAEMMEDAMGGIAVEAKRRAESFTRAYYKTINKLCTTVLRYGMSPSCTFANANIDLTTFDGLPLFSSQHKWGSGTNSGTQSNCYCGDIFGTTVNGTRTYSAEQFEQSLTELSSKLRAMKDENGEPLGYTADTIIVPANKPALEIIVKKVCGTVSALGNGYNDINLNYGNYNVIVLPTWQMSTNTIMIMSSEANKNLSGNMFYNRVPLTISNWVDHHTGNYIWNGRCRFGVGFGTYKHILFCTDSSNTISGMTKL